MEEARHREQERPFEPEAQRESYAQPHHFAVNDVSWREKAKRIIAELSRQSYDQAQRLSGGGKAKRHRPYSIPEAAQRLVEALDRNDEEAAKAIFLYDYDAQQAQRSAAHHEPNAGRSAGRALHLPGHAGHTLCGEEAHAATLVPSVTDSTCYYCNREWERQYERGHTPNADGGTIRYVLKQITPDGLWVSPDVFSAETPRHVAQNVIAGMLWGQPRWAETSDGRFLYGLDAKGKEMRAAPPHGHTPNAPYAPAEMDRHAATDLVLFIENTADLSLDGPHGQGRSVLLNALRKFRKGTYDPAQAVRLFEYLTESGARRYVQENRSSLPWNQMFSVATRREAARQLSESFRSSAEKGEYDEVDTRIGAR